MKIHVVAEGKLEIPVACRLIDFCGHQRGRESILYEEPETSEKML